MKKWFKKRKKLKIALFIFFLLVLVAGFYANAWVKKKGYRNLWDFITTVGSNYNKSFSAEYETLEINISSNDFKKLEEVRNKAIKRGILIDEGGSFVEATLKHKGKKIKARLRLKGHMTDHLQTNKWSFRIVTQKGDAFMGMKRFSVQHPGTRNYFYEWIYHQMMKSEGIIALNYDFIRLKVNGDDWGIYAVEEHFAQELIARNERVKGPIIRFNPELYWSHRIAELNKSTILHEYVNMQMTYIEAYDDKNTYEDSTLLRGYARAVMLMEMFRRGELKTRDVFDIEKLARFHAIIDLVGGHHSLDWSDVKYYYNSETDKLEPIAYESFSIRPTTVLSGSHRFSNVTPAYITDLHNALFSDPAFFRLYIRELKRIGSKKWLDGFLKKIDGPLQNKLATVYIEFPYKNYKPDDYYKNIKNIAQLLNKPKGFHAFVNKVSSDSIFVSIAGIDALPFELLAIKIDSVKIKPAQQVFIPSHQSGQYLRYQDYAFALPENLRGKIKGETKLKIEYCLVGTSEIKKTDIIPVAAYNEKSAAGIKDQLRNPNVNEFPFVTVLDAVKEIHFATGVHQVSKNIVIPAGYIVKINPGTTFNLINGAGIISYSAMIVKGSDESVVQFTSTDSSGTGLSILNTQEASVFFRVNFSLLGSKNAQGKGASFSAYQADARFRECIFFNNQWNALSIVRSNVNLNSSAISGAKEDGMSVSFSKITIEKCRVYNIQEDGLEATGSVVQLNNSEFKNIHSAAIAARQLSNVKVKNNKLINAGLGVESKDRSDVEIASSQLEKCKIGFKAHKKGNVFGPSKIISQKCKFTNVDKKIEQEKNSVIKIQ